MRLWSNIKAMAWQIAATALLLVLAVQTIRIDGLRVPLVGLHLVEGLKPERDRLLADVTNLKAFGERMQAESGKEVVRWRTRIVERKPIIKRVENAPLPGQCKTPDLVLESVE